MMSDLSIIKSKTNRMKTKRMIFLLSFDCCKNLLIEKWNSQRKFRHQDTIQLKILLTYSIRHRFQKIAKKRLKSDLQLHSRRQKNCAFLILHCTDRYADQELEYWNTSMMNDFINLKNLSKCELRLMMNQLNIHRFTMQEASMWRCKRLNF